MPQPLVWVQLKQEGTKPSSRSGHSLTAVASEKGSRTFILFGGLDSEKKAGKIAPNNQVYTLRFSPNQPNTAEWKLLSCSGDLPLPRTNHAACTIGPDKLYVFGGLYSSNQRFNDSYILRVNTASWSQPPNQRSTGEPKNTESKIGAPEPRANHSATFAKGKVYIFGGHGGVGYQRKAFNDLYALDVDTWEWQLLEPTGTPPEPRGGHVAALLPENKGIIIYGGWSNSTQCANMMIYDLDKNAWQDPEIAYEIPRWNHCGCMYEYPPSWKYFAFGGSSESFDDGAQRNFGHFKEDLIVFDISSMRWSLPELEKNAAGALVKPKARESAQMIYDHAQQRMLVFGGWANTWLDDLWALNISLITGPTYAIFGIKPNLGPVTGKTKITITGIGFPNSPNINVRFQAGKNVLDAKAEYVSNTEISCETPSFEAVGPREAEIRVSCDKQDYTTTMAKFAYFLNTKADRTIAFGPGLLRDNMVNEDTIFTIQSRNQLGENRKSGDDEFIVHIKPWTAEDEARLRAEIEAKLHPKTDEEKKEEEAAAAATAVKDKKGGKPDPKKKEEAPPPEEAPKEENWLPVTVKDLGNGKYSVSYKHEVEGEVWIEVLYKNEKGEVNPIRGSPFRGYFTPKATIKKNSMTSQTMLSYIGGSLDELENFVHTTRENINIKGKNLDDDVYALLKIKDYLGQNYEKKDEINLRVDVLEQILHYFEENGVNRETDLKRIAKLQDEWVSLQKMAITVEKEIAPYVKTESEKTKANIKKFEETLKFYFNELKKESFYQYATGVEESFARIAHVNKQIEKYEQTLKDYEYYSRMFGFPDDVLPAGKNLDTIKAEVNSYTLLWKQIRKCLEKIVDYKARKWAAINSLDMEDEVKKLRKELTDLRGIDRRQTAYSGIAEELKRWATFLPLVGELKDPAMEVEDHRHWTKIKKMAKTETDVTGETTLEVIWQMRLFDFKDPIEEITDQAKQEAKMEKTLKKISEKWKDVDFELIKHKETEINTLKMSDENFETLEEHQVQIQNMFASKFLAYFEAIVTKWQRSLASTYEVVQLLSEVQKSWSFLENLFIGSEEVKKELPKESEEFVGIDKEVKAIMKEGGSVKNVNTFCNQENIFTRLETVQKQLIKCEKALYTFLDEKRKAFPRFYFVSVADLLDILSNGNNPGKINKHMPKIFQAIDHLELPEVAGDRPTAKGMHANVGKEYVPFNSPLKLVGKVEVYLTQVIDVMIATLREKATKSLKDVQTMQRVDWIKEEVAQLCLLINMINWVEQTESAFQKISGGNLDAMKNYYKEAVEKLTALIKMVQGNLDKSVRQKVMCLITMETHSRDVIDRLIQENVRKPDEFQWQSQLKFSWDVNKKDARVNIADAQLWYAYEYLGNGPRLVVTPLTDRIYVTATQALNLNMGCAPAGPAGTGKTETTKDLANAVGKACYVFNCSGEMTYESMGNIFKGLASSGAWGCFDEFNRLVPEVLSVCSVQFKAVTDAIKQKKQRFVIQSDEINLDPTCAAFITMNPGYLGRSELPEGLKALFRPITVVVPDLELICENMLMAEGFVDAKILAKKFVTLYSLCRDLLSKQDHYDWGLRAIKSVLVVAGTFKRAEADIAEAALLMRALRDFNIPKIVQADMDIFMGLLGDIFPGIKIERKRNMDFEGLIEKACVENKLTPAPEFVLKVVQLFELLEIRHCVFVMGPPGAGKSSTWKMLAKAQDKDGKKTMFIDLDPKVVSTKDLYGYTNMATKEWKDGLFSKTMKNLGEIADTNPKWLLLDGDLDANWIESMNSVMDDNKLLTLANNDRIPLKPHMRIIFEIRDLRFATPATVSRAGILYISDDTGYQWRAYVKSWLDHFQDENQKIALQKLFDKYVEQTLVFLKKTCKYVVPVSQISMIISLCKGLQPYCFNQQGEIKNLEHIFTFVMVWACGGPLMEKDGEDYRKVFSNWWKNEMKTIKFPGKGTIFDYFVDQGDQVRFEEWSKKVEEIEFDSATMQMQNITVPTPETVSSQEFIKNFIINSHPVLLIGLAGCGKTQLSKGLLREIIKKNPEGYQTTSINFNYYTESMDLQGMLEAPLEKKAGRQYGPPGKARLIYFIDDLNMPKLDPYNTQTAIALLRQHADYGHWYDVGKLSLKEISNTQTIAAMNPSAGSFYVNPRYQRHFWLCSVPFPESNSLYAIYFTFMNGHFKKFKPAIQEQIPVIIKATLQLHQSVSQTFRKTAINFHYEFNIRHLAGVFQGLLLAQPPQFQDPEKLVRIWIHESERVYGDRLVSLENLTSYKAIVADLVKKNFSKFSMQRFFQANNPENLIFCNFTGGLMNDRVYDQMANDKLEGHINDALKEYNDNNPVMDLVLFDDAMKHVCRITRIVSSPSGHALLVGVGGSGKQSLAKLSAFICGYATSQIVLSSTYGMNELKADLQALYLRTGVKEDGVLFLLTDSQIADEKFLVYFNDLLSSGEIADLYTNDEKDVLVNQVRAKVKADGIPDTKENCWSWYISKVKANLHVALCFSPVGEVFRRRARQFPALVNCTVIDWFQPWPQDALLNVAENFIKNLDLGEEAVRKAVVRFMPFSFKTVNQASLQMLEQERRYIYTTPKSFLELIKLYTSMLGKKREALEKNKERYESGLIRLRETAEMVAKLEEELKLKQIEVEAKKKEADSFADTVGKEKAKVEHESSKANVEAEKCQVIQRDVEEKKASTQKDLDAALPLVEKAQAALNDISAKDFQEAKNFNNPPKGVPDIFAACMFLLATFDPNVEIDAKSKKPKAVDYKAAKKLMKNPEDLKKKLLSYKELIDTGQVPSQNVQQVRPLLALDHFNPVDMRAKSLAAEGLCNWVVNIVAYYDVVQEVEPKRKALREATEQLEAANTKLQEVTATVARFKEELGKLEAEYAKAIAEKEAVIAEADKCASRLGLAQRLVRALSSENERWAKAIIDLGQQLGLVVGDVLLASAFVSYVGPFNKKFRDQLVKDHFMKFMVENKIPMTPNANPLKLLTDDATIAVWNNQGLPSDAVSVQNGTILTNSERYPLMIDPQLQGITWIKEKEKNSNLQITRMGNSNMVRLIENSVEAGYSLLIENMDEQVDAILNPVIGRNFAKRGRNKVLKFAGKDLIVHEKFRLFLQTKLSNPHYPPEIQAEATLINFTVTENGLGDQLLTLVVSKERPDLAKMKSELIQQQNSFKIKLKELEDGLLYQLANAQGDILGNVTLIENLEDSKRISTEITEKVEIARVTEAKINEASEAYRPAASRGALIFFLMNDLNKIHTFYMYSLDAFVVVIKRAIDIVAAQEAAGFKGSTTGPGAMTVASPEKKPTLVEAPAKAQTTIEGSPTKGEEKKAEGEGEKKPEGEAAVDAKPEGEEEKKAEGEAVDAPKEDGAPAPEQLEAAQLSPRSLSKRVEKLTESITFQSFQYIRRGLFERHKLIVATMLCFRILIRQGKLEEHEVDHLIRGKVELQVPPIPEQIKSFTTDLMWAAIKALEALPPFKELAQSLEQDPLLWKKWYGEEKAEAADLPRNFKEISKFHRLMILRAMRPDRCAAALQMFVSENLGTEYVELTPINMSETFLESSKQTAIFFVLFPGVDPTPEVERIGHEYGKTIANGKFTNISMGQGQEETARKALIAAGKDGNWIMLQNVHLMQSWLKTFERSLEQVIETAHADFRCFISSEPPPLPDMKIIPESILQNCIKVANEAPQDLKANLRRAYAHFSEDTVKKSAKPNEFKAILLGLCVFHSLVLGRRKFGSQGWSRVYNFNDGDLTICADVLHNYLSKYDQVPYDDLRYIYGEIMYGGHITDNWDRRTCNTYLRVLIKPELLSNTTIIPGFKSPDPAKFDYNAYWKYIDKLPPESPIVFGLHPNAEINYLTSMCDTIFRTIIEVQGGGSAGTSKKDDGAMGLINDFKTRLPKQYNIIDITMRIKEKTPYLVVCLQECERMNTLLGEIDRSLEELKLGLLGALNITDAMEVLSRALSLNRVPDTWEKVAYFSKKPLLVWFSDLIDRTIQLHEWTKELIMPKSLCIAWLFNPMSFLTAIMQVTARAKGLPLDNMALQTDVTGFKAPEETPGYAEQGFFVHGLYLEGAAWDSGTNGTDGYLIEQKLKELHPKLPVVNVIAVPAEKKKRAGQYQCPVYVTSGRGPTYVFTANMNMESEDMDPAKWILSGVALLMSDD